MCRVVATVCHRGKCKLNRRVFWAKAIAFQGHRLFFSRERHADSRIFSAPSGYYLHPCMWYWENPELLPCTVQFECRLVTGIMF